MKKEYKNITRISIALFMAVMLTMSMFMGCANQEAGYYNKLAATINASVEAQQAVTNKIVKTLRETSLVDDEKMAEIEITLSKVDKFVDTAQLAAADAAETYEAKLADGKLAATLESFRTANAVSAPVNPYAGVIEGVLGLAVAIAIGYAAKKRSEANTATKKYTAHKRVVEANMWASNPDEAKVLYEKIGIERTKLGI